MTIINLIKELQQYPADAIVCIADIDSPGFKKIFTVGDPAEDPSGRLHVAIVAADPVLPKSDA